MGFWGFGVQYMAQAQERASGPSLHHFTTPNALQRLSHTHFPAKHEHKASISTSNHNQNTNAGLPYIHRSIIYVSNSIETQFEADHYFTVLLAIDCLSLMNH